MVRLNQLDRYKLIFWYEQGIVFYDSHRILIIFTRRYSSCV
jgi:hypothetical protein